MDVHENLVMRSLGTGYLKVPKQVKVMFADKYGLEVKDLPNPEASYEQKDGYMSLTFKFPLDELEEQEEP